LIGANPNIYSVPEPWAAGEIAKHTEMKKGFRNE
jgi:hypothetical protein